MKAQRGLCITLVLTMMSAFIWAGSALALDLPDKFDYLGPEMKHFTNKAGRELIYVDEGEKDWQTVLFFGGAGTSVQAFYMTEFVRSLRNNLKLRVISLERNGFGQTEFVPGQNYQDYANNVKELLDHLKIKSFAGVAISGGGPYLAAVAETVPDRVRSLHFAAAYSFAKNGPLGSCAAFKDDYEKFTGDLSSWIKNPMIWWDLGQNTSIHKIPAFQDTANNEGAHAYFIRGQMADPAPVIHEYTQYCTVEAPEKASDLTAPVFIYQGTADQSVAMTHADFWQAHFAKSAARTVRIYPDEGHDVQYRHWDQILLDMAERGDQTLICRQGGKAELADPAEAEKLLASGEAAPGLCMWQ